MVEKFKKLYNEIVIPYLNENLEYKNIQEIPKIKKIQINRGLGIAAQNTKILKKSIEEFRAITGQNPIVTKAKQSIAGFKVREKMELGVTITLRGEKMYSFLDRLINLALPRIRDFQGLDPQKFDKNGNYNLGISEQLVFPEIDYDSVEQRRGFNITIVTTAKNSKEAFYLLQELGLPYLYG
jgi:large subunit ribosomal protein L5